MSKTSYHGGYHYGVCAEMADQADLRPEKSGFSLEMCGAEPCRLGGGVLSVFPSLLFLLFVPDESLIKGRHARFYKGTPGRAVLGGVFPGGMNKGMPHCSSDAFTCLYSAA